MSTIGVGKAFRNQDREGRRQRSRREERMSDRRADNQAAEWTDGDAELQTCASCGAEDHSGNLYHSSAGEVCGVCFADGEGELLEIAPAPPLGTLLARPLPVLLLFGPYLLWLAFGMDLVQTSGYGMAISGTVSNVVIVFLKVPFFFGFVAGWILTPVVFYRTVMDVLDDTRRPEMALGQKTTLVAARLWGLVGYCLLLAAASRSLSAIG